MSTELQRVIVSDTFLKYVSLVLRSELWIEYYISQLLIRKVGLASVSQPMVLNSVIRLKRHLEPELMRSLKDSNNTSVKDRKTSIKKSHCFFFSVSILTRLQHILRHIEYIHTYTRITNPSPLMCDRFLIGMQPASPSCLCFQICHGFRTGCEAGDRANKRSSHSALPHYSS